MAVRFSTPTTPTARSLRFSASRPRLIPVAASWSAVRTQKDECAFAEWEVATHVTSAAGYEGSAVNDDRILYVGWRAGASGRGGPPFVPPTVGDPPARRTPASLFGSWTRQPPLPQSSALRREKRVGSTKCARFTVSVSSVRFTFRRKPEPLWARSPKRGEMHLARIALSFVLSSSL